MRIKRFADFKGKKIISVCMYNDWCDKNATASPLEFLSLLYHADYIITSTFHGTIFSILFHKKFGVFANGNYKITELLSMVGLMKHDITEQYNISDNMDEVIDYDNVDDKITEYRAIGLDKIYKTLRYLND